MVEKVPRLITVDEAAAQPYATVLAYPRPERNEVWSKIQQLKKLGIDKLEFNGHLRLDDLSVLGKGVAGMVIVGITPGQRVALKVRRSDSRRDSMRYEASMLQLANSADVGPKYLGNTNDILEMELVGGETLPRWLASLHGRGRRSRLRAVIGNLLEQCFSLDRVGLDHGELSRAHKNILVTPNGNPRILDFESASKYRRATNVTSLAQYFFLGGGFSRKIVRVLGPVDREKLVGFLRGYKSRPSARTFGEVMEFLKLEA